MIKILLLVPLTGNGGIASWTKKFIETFPDEEFAFFPLNISPDRNMGSGFMNRIFTGLKALKRVMRELRQNVTTQHFDIMHTTTSGSIGTLRDYCVAKYCKKHGLKTVMHCHYGCIPQDVKSKGLLGHLLRKTMCLYDQIWVLDNYLDSADELAMEEQIAVNIFINRRIAERKQSSPFVKTESYRLLLSDADYQAISKDEKEAIECIIQNRSVPKEDRIPVKTTKVARSLLKRYYDRYENDIQRSSRESDSLINVMYAKYAWAITVHKAVGSKFDNVILKGFRTENDGICNESYFRWLYSGLSVAAGVFYIVQPQFVHPFMNCAMSETDSGLTPPKQLLIYDGYKVPSRFAEMVALDNVNASAAVCELAKLIEPRGYILEEVKPCNGYLTKAVFSVPQGIKKKLVIDFHNKGAKDSYGISQIRMEPNEFVDATCIEQGIDTVFSLAVSCNKFVETPDGFINKIEVFDITDITIVSEVREVILKNRQNYNSESENDKI